MYCPAVKVRRAFCIMASDKDYLPFEGQTIWNNGNGYSVPSFGETGNQTAGSIFDPFGLVSGLYNDLTGVTSQSREFAQQEYLQDKMNEYNTPANQMARMKAAGINPNIAASGIAQSGSESAQAPAVSSNTQGASAGLSAVGSALGGVANLALVAAQKKNLDADSTEKMAAATRTNSLLFYEQNKFEAETAELWTKNGMEASMADYWSTKAAYADQNEYLDVQGKLWNIAKCSSDIDLLNEEVKLKRQDVNLRKEQVTEQQYKNEMLEIDKYFAQERKRIYQERGIDVNQSEDGMLIEAYANGQSQFILDAYKARSKQIAAGSLEATREQLREQLQIEWEENLKGRAQQIEQDEELGKALAKYGVKGDVMKMIIRDVVKYLFGTGFSVKAQGPFGIGGGITNSPAE